MPRGPGDVPAGAPSAGPGAPAPGLPQPAPPQRLLERERELEALERAVEVLLEGTSGVLVVEGPPGIGKTVLVERAVQLARARGVRVVATAAGQLERDLAFGVVRSLLAGQLPSGPPGDGGPRGTWTQALPALSDALRALADDGPAAVVVDDLHWADTPSLHALDALVRNLPPRLGLMLTTRSAGPDVERVPLQVLLARTRLQTLRPSPLSREAVRRVLDEDLGASPGDAVVAACHRATGGNPLLLRQLVLDLQDRRLRPDEVDPELVSELGESTVAELVLHRLGRLEPAARQVARSAAVLGTSASTATVSALTGLAREVVVSAAEELVGADVLDRDRPYAFVHPLVHAAVYAHAPAVWRAEAHAAAAALLLRDGADVEDVAAHLLRTEPGGADGAADVLLRAARRSLERGSPDAALEHLRAALPQAGPRRAEVLALLGHTELLLTDPACVEHLEQALAGTDDPEAVVATSRALARVHGDAGAWDRAEVVLDDALARLPDDADPQLRLSLRADLLRVLQGSASWVDHAALAEELAEELGVQDGEGGTTPCGRVVLAHLAAVRLFRGAPAEQVRALARRALGDGAMLAEQTTDSPAWQMAAGVLGVAGDPAAAVAELEAGERDAAQRGSVVGLVQVRLVLAWAALHSGALTRAVELAESVLELVAGRGRSVPDRYARACLATALLELGRDGDAQAVLDAAEEPERPDRNALLLQQVRARLSAQRHELEPAAALLEQAGAWYAAHGIPAPAELSWHHDLVPVLVALGRADRAREVAEQGLALTEGGAPRPLGRALHAAALAAPLAERERLLHRAHDVLAASPARLAHAEVLVDLGATLRRLGRTGDARGPLRDGLALAEECSALPLAERARRELRLAGGRSSRSSAGLTRAERQVCELVATGLTNRAVAQELFVSVKTVEKHLGNAFAKLGVSARGELAEALAELGGVEQ